jgi:hypothetical protein
MKVHPVASSGFAAAADEYERGRPDYPSAAIRWLAGRVGLGVGATVVDLAAGTGKLSRPLAATGARVIAVEPVEAMRLLVGICAGAIAGASASGTTPGTAVADVLLRAMADVQLDDGRQVSRSRPDAYLGSVPISS